MTAWTNTTRCTRCLDVIEPGKIHWCATPDTNVSTRDPHDIRQWDPATLRAMADRWDSPKAPDARVTFFCDGRAVVYSPGYLLRLVADAMEDQAKEGS